MRPEINLPLLVIARICTTAVFMTYPACLRVLLEAWNMTATQGGMVQGAFTAAFAISLLGASYLCDRIGAKRVYNTATFLSAGASLIFAATARSYETALLSALLIGFAQGGTYTPAIMLVSAHSLPGRAASAIGWVLSGMSAGYVVSIALSTALLGSYGYQAAFWATGVLPAFGWAIGYLAVRRVLDRQPEPAADFGNRVTPDKKRRSRLLIVGYVGHCWELFGAWAWLPAFLGAALVTATGMSAIELGLWIALTIHASGFFASFLSGMAADRCGVKRVLILFGGLGAVCSAIIGWLPASNVAVLLCFAIVYGFATIGDSAVLSSAMTDTVPKGRLGGKLGLRSVLGVGAGSLSPIVFGTTLDLYAGTIGWGIAFSILALGGAIATICAARL
jgi:MFS family permease